MIGDDRVRFCRRCEQNVYNIAEMSRVEAQALLESNEGRRCVRVFRRADGTILTKDCPEGRREQQVQFARLGSRMALAFGLAAGTALIPLLARRSHPAPMTGLTVVAAPARPAVEMGDATRFPPPEPVMGSIAVQPIEPPPPVLMGKVRIAPKDK
jgi:hypothetical protein